MSANKTEAMCTEINDILKELSEKNIERLLWFARGLLKNDYRLKKQKLTHN